MMKTELGRAAVGWFSLVLVGCLIVIPVLPLALG
jgi:hypothetical protein